MTKVRFSIVSLLLVMALAIVACSTPEPEIIEVTVEVEKVVVEEVEVVKEVEVEVEKEVEVIKEVEVEVVKEVEVAAEISNRGTLRVAHDMSWGGTEVLNPVDPSRFAPPTILLYEGLTNIVNGRPVPNLAKDWSSDDTATVWTINLREGVKFHSGNEMTAADVIYTANHWITPPSIIAGVFESVVDSVEAIDDYTVQFNLKQGFADFPLTLSSYQAVIIEEGTAENIYDAEASMEGTINMTGNGTGAFMLENLDVEGVTTLVANDNYWAGPPGIGKIEVIGIADASAQLNAFLGGQIDILDMNSDDAALVEAQGGLDVISFPDGGWDAFVMRVDVAPYDNPILRRALRVGVDRQAMVDIVLGGNGIVSCDTPVKADDQYRFDADCANGDPELAKELLAEAGYNGETLVLKYSDVCANWAPMAEVYQQQMAEIGVNIELETVPSDGYWSDTWQTEPFTATCWGERTADQILNEAYRSGASWSDTFYANPDFDAALDAARAELDFETRRGHYVDAQAMLWDNGGSLIPFHAKTFRGTSQCVVGMTPVGVFYIPYHSMSVTPGCE